MKCILINGQFNVMQAVFCYLFHTTLIISSHCSILINVVNVWWNYMHVQNSQKLVDTVEAEPQVMSGCKCITPHWVLHLHHPPYSLCLFVSLSVFLLSLSHTLTLSVYLSLPIPLSVFSLSFSHTLTLSLLILYEQVHEILHYLSVLLNKWLSVFAYLPLQIKCCGGHVAYSNLYFSQPKSGSLLALNLTWNVVVKTKMYLKPGS